MNLARKYKIHRLSPCLNGEELEIITFIESKIKDLRTIIDDKYPESTFYINSNGITILEQDDKNGRLWVSYHDFCEVLEKKYLLNTNDSEDIIRYMVLVHLKFRSSPSPSKLVIPLPEVLVHLKFRSSPSSKLRLM